MPPERGTVSRSTLNSRDGISFSRRMTNSVFRFPIRNPPALRDSASLFNGKPFAAGLGNPSALRIGMTLAFSLSRRPWENRPPNLPRPIQQRQRRCVPQPSGYGGMRLVAPKRSEGGGVTLGKPPKNIIYSEGVESVLEESFAQCQK
jgi:hypothetical protein